MALEDVVEEVEDALGALTCKARESEWQQPVMLVTIGANRY